MLPNFYPLNIYTEEGWQIGVKMLIKMGWIWSELTTNQMPAQVMVVELDSTSYLIASS